MRGVAAAWNCLGCLDYDTVESKDGLAGNGADPDVRAVQRYGERELAVL
jgi:hypothetical protein